MYRTIITRHSHHFGIPLLLLSTVLWWSCEDQTPTSIDSQGDSDPLAGEPIVVSVLSLDYNYQTSTFFVTVNALARDTIAAVTGSFIFDDSVFTTLTLEDDGQGDDILPNDGFYNATWTDSLINPDTQRDWTFKTTAVSVSGDSATASDNIRLTLPVAPVIESVVAPDSLHLDNSAWVLDTLRVRASHPEGLDEIRDVTFRSKKPADTNFGPAYELFDDGGAVVLFIIPLGNDTLRLTSFDKIAGDGVYSFPIALSPGGQTGINRWQIQARAWNGQVSPTVADSLVILPSQMPPRQLNDGESLIHTILPWN